MINQYKSLYRSFFLIKTFLLERRSLTPRKQTTHKSQEVPKTYKIPNLSRVTKAVRASGGRTVWPAELITNQRAAFLDWHLCWDGLFSDAAICSLVKYSSPTLLKVTPMNSLIHQVGLSWNHCFGISLVLYLHEQSFVSISPRKI